MSEQFTITSILSALVVALTCVPAACEFEPIPTPTALVEIERAGDAAQATSPEFGVHLVLQGWGGASVWLEVDGGELRNEGMRAACLSLPHDGALVDVFVVPDDVEVRLTAELYTRACPQGGSTKPKGTAVASDAELVGIGISNSMDTTDGETDGETA